MQVGVAHLVGQGVVLLYLDIRALDGRQRIVVHGLQGEYTLGKDTGLRHDLDNFLQVLGRVLGITAPEGFGVAGGYLEGRNALGDGDVTLKHPEIGVGLGDRLDFHVGTPLQLAEYPVDVKLANLAGGGATPVTECAAIGTAAIGLQGDMQPRHAPVGLKQSHQIRRGDGVEILYPLAVGVPENFAFVPVTDSGDTGQHGKIRAFLADHAAQPVQGFGSAGFAFSPDDDVDVREFIEVLPRILRVLRSVGAAVYGNAAGTTSLHGLGYRDTLLVGPQVIRKQVDRGSGGKALQAVVIPDPVQAKIVGLIQAPAVVHLGVSHYQSQCGGNGFTKGHGYHLGSVHAGSLLSLGLLFIQFGRLPRKVLFQCLLETHRFARGNGRLGQRHQAGTVEKGQHPRQAGFVQSMLAEQVTLSLQRCGKCRWLAELRHRDHLRRTQCEQEPAGMVEQLEFAARHTQGQREFECQEAGMDYRVRLLHDRSGRHHGPYRNGVAPPAQAAGPGQ
ncbi:MAG: hypothetical protein R3E50_13225 [Halioglobus sp.]